MPNTTVTSEVAEARELARAALDALSAAESAAYMASPLFTHGGTWNDSPIGEALYRAESALRAIIGHADYGDVQAHALNMAQDAYTKQVTSR